jgi:hypothetical protein
VGVALGVGLTVALEVGDTVVLGVGVRLGVGVAVFVAMGDGVDDGEGEGVGGTGVKVGSTVMVGVAVSCAVGQFGHGSHPATVRPSAIAVSSAAQARFAGLVGINDRNTSVYCLMATPETTWKQSVPVRSIRLTTLENVKELFPVVVAQPAPEPALGVKTTLSRVPSPSGATV